MPTPYFLPSKIIQPYNDFEFVSELISVIDQIVSNFPAGMYPVTLNASALEFNTPALQTDTVVLSLGGTVAYLYVRFFKEPYPMLPTNLQREKINAIWDYIGHPENKLDLI
jgi:hypothetical protein